MLRGGYDQWLKWLAQSQPAALEICPLERATIDRLRQWYGDLSKVRPKTRLYYVSSLLRILEEAAPDRDWGAHQKLVSRLRSGSGTGDPSRKAGRIFDSGLLCKLGLDYAQTHPKAASTELKSAARFRTGTMIALLAVMPMRRMTFCKLQLGSSVWIDKDRIIIAASGDMMKRGNTWEAEVPDVVLDVLRHYLDTVRPWLMQRANLQHPFLWVNDLGKPYDPCHLSNRIAWSTKEILGTRVSAHLFRDAAATTLARHSPASAKLIAPLLGHSSLETAERHYIHANSIDAGRTYANVLARKLKG
jgi:integrase/recombinase XerD